MVAGAVTYDAGAVLTSPSPSGGDVDEGGGSGGDGGVNAEGG
jgi:hypothetical protein